LTLAFEMKVMCSGGEVAAKLEKTTGESHTTRGS